jgi:putative SOS response-associated peptidase YedK
MCFFSVQSKTTQELQNRFNAKFENAELYKPGAYNGFQFPQTPVITNKHPYTIKLYGWGLIPFWSKDETIRAKTLNARVETIHQKPSFRSVVSNRCLVLADGFYEWQWLDEKGKQKQKYELALPNNEPFAFAGLWSEWLNKSTGELIYTYTILTTEANELMSKIHNSKKRMPVIISPNHEQDWLQGKVPITQNNRLIATKTL